MRENVDTKARRYLVEGRVLIRHVDKSTVVAHIRGSDSYYRVVGDEHGWTCDCPARRRCSHETAVMLVTLRPQGRNDVQAEQKM
jgi:uncharacterized Zn finger protein